MILDEDCSCSEKGAKVRSVFQKMLREGTTNPAKCVCRRIREPVISRMISLIELRAISRSPLPMIDHSIAVCGRVGDRRSIVFRSFDAPSIAISNEFHLTAISPPAIHIPRQGRPQSFIGT